MKAISLAIVIQLLVFLHGNAQPNYDTTAKKEAITKLSMLIGSWEGSGWASSPDGSRNEFTQSETIETKLDGIALLVQGLGKRKSTEEVIHDALAIITYDEVDSTYSFQSYLAIGQSTTAKGYFENGKFIWGFEVPSGQVKYTITIRERSQWNEIGEFSRDGNQWYPFMEMNLEKIKE